MILKQIFLTENPIYIFGMTLVLGVLAALEVSYWRAKRQFPGMFAGALVSIMASALIVALFGNAYSLNMDPAYTAVKFIPTIGMLFGNCMIGVSIGMSAVMDILDTHRGRIEAMLSFGASRWEVIRPVVVDALRTALVPTITNMGITGLISIPGVMTGWILGGADVLQAARYQQIILFMISAATASSTLIAVIFCASVLVDRVPVLRLDRIKTAGTELAMSKTESMSRAPSRLALLRASCRPKSELYLLRNASSVSSSPTACNEDDLQTAGSYDWQVSVVADAALAAKDQIPIKERRLAKKAAKPAKLAAKLAEKKEVRAKRAEKKAAKKAEKEAKKEESDSDSSDAESSSSEEEEKPAKVAAKEESSSDSDSSDSESEAKVETAKAESSDSGSDSDSDSDSSSDEKAEDKAESSADSDSDSSDSDSDSSDADMAEDSDSGKRKADSDVEMEDSDESSKQKKQKTSSEPASLFVGNLPFSATVESMKDTFAQFGEVVDARIATDSSTGRPRGFGYVDFASEEARDKAMASDYVEIEGRQLRMDVATTKSNKREDGASSSNPTNPPSKTLFMGNMSFHSTEDSIREAFSECGEVVSVRIVTDRETGRPKGFGYIEFETVEAATSAIAWNGTDLDGRNIRLDYSTPRTNDGGGRGGGRGGFRGGRGGGGRGGGFRGGRGGGRGGGGRFNSNY
ncbi:hypothetical protein GGH96_004821 [Coemansia sp. RSA 1972]|nr:hypothetical protein GGH96_004821 [Coemansia sp. RSA 1972]